MSAVEGPFARSSDNAEYWEVAGVHVEGDDLVESSPIDALDRFSSTAANQAEEDAARLGRGVNDYLED